MVSRSVTHINDTSYVSLNWRASQEEIDLIVTVSVALEVFDRS